tara:strand:+ start:494 stop:787 length:294 start_codon:yes stop_codon:yes gene_type:complete
MLIVYLKKEGYIEAYNSFQSSYIIDTVLYENLDIRTAAYNNIVFGNRSEAKSKLFLQKLSITHIFVKSKKVKTINPWIDNLSKIKSKNFVIYTCLFR